MKRTLIFSGLVILFFSHFGVLYAQQGQGPDNMTESEQSPADSTAYMWVGGNTI